LEKKTDAAFRSMRTYVRVVKVYLLGAKNSFPLELTTNFITFKNVCSEMTLAPSVAAVIS
jgi:hypothetical protein